MHGRRTARAIARIERTSLMSAKKDMKAGLRSAARFRQYVMLAIGAALLVAMALGTTVVPIDQVKSDVFSPAVYGKKDSPYPGGDRNGRRRCGGAGGGDCG